MKKKKKLDIKVDGQEIKAGGQGLLMGTVALLLGVLTVWGIKRAFGNSIEESKLDKARRQALIPGTPENFAQRIFLAIDGIGTDESEVFTVFNSLPSRAFYNRMYEAYSILTQGDNLEEDLRNDLSSSDLFSIEQILASKP